MRRHKWEGHSVTEINGAGVHVERWEECIACGDMRNEFESPSREFCPGAVANSILSQYSAEETKERGKDS